MPVSIYPPTLASTQPAFVANDAQNYYPIYFTLQRITTFSEIGHIQVRIVKQSNNASVVNTSLYPDGTIYKDPSETDHNNGYAVIINTPSDLAEPWQPGILYKIQMRFGTTKKYASIAEFADWKKKQIDNQTFSEWSTVMVVKAISAPEVIIENAEAVSSIDTSPISRTEPTLTPLFFGFYKVPEIEKELADEYLFNLYLGGKTLEEFKSEPNTGLVESSGWKQHNARDGSSDRHRFKYQLINNTEYTLIYSVKTVNGYQGYAKPYKFLATRTYLAELTGVQLYIEDNSEYVRENGCLNIHLTADNLLSGAFVLTRASEETNYTVWEDLKYFVFIRQKFNNTVIYSDFTIESGVRYKYAFQQENSEGLRSSPIYDANNSPHYIDFEYCYLYHDDLQLRLMFNQKMSSFKHTVLTSKQDTLGDRYPHLTKNGYAYYAEFPVTGLISFQMDPDRTFLKLQNSGFVMDSDTKIPRDKFIEWDEDRRPCMAGQDSSGLPGQTTNYNRLTIDKNLTNNNIFIERRFRDEVEKFLNNFDYKLYKSPTEGNIVIVLQNVTMTPNSTLGRMLYEFSATAYEVAENTLENLDKYGLINIGEFGVISNEDTILSVGQLKGKFVGFKDTPINLYNEIKKQEEISIGGGYRLSLKYLRSFWVEYYPPEESVLDKTFNDKGQLIEAHPDFRPTAVADISRLQAELAQIRNGEIEGNEEEVLAEIKYYQDIQSRMPIGPDGIKQVPPMTTRIQVGGQPIIVAPNKVYALTENIKELKLLSATYPIIINYVCELNQIEDTTLGVITAVDSSRIWGQAAGIFTDTDAIIREGYQYDYGPGIPPYQVYSSSSIGAIKDEFGDIILDATNIPLFKTLNLYEVIKEQTRKQVEKIYSADDKWNSGKVDYNFSGIVSFDIEADEGTSLKIGKAEDGSDAITVKIGKTRHYALTPMENLIRYICLEKPAFAIVNYKCLTSQMILKF